MFSITVTIRKLKLVLHCFPGRRMDGCMKEIGQTIRSSTSEIREKAMLATSNIVKLKVRSMQISLNCHTKFLLYCLVHNFFIPNHLEFWIYMNFSPLCVLFIENVLCVIRMKVSLKDGSGQILFWNKCSNKMCSLAKNQMNHFSDYGCMFEMPNTCRILEVNWCSGSNFIILKNITVHFDLCLLQITLLTVIPTNRLTSFLVEKF